MTDVLIENVEPRPGSKYALVIAVAKRAKQLREGSPKLVDIKSRNHITIALEEIAQGLTKIHLPSLEEIEASERRDSSPKHGSVRHAAEVLMPVKAEETAVDVVEASIEDEPVVDLASLLAVDVDTETDGEDEIAANEDADDVEAVEDVEPEEIPEIELSDDDDDEPLVSKDE